MSFRHPVEPHLCFVPSILSNGKRLRAVGNEIAMAAILVRAGCDVKWIDPKNALHGIKSCELIATHRSTGISFAVEAKSKHRNGILNQKGTFDTKAEYQDICHLTKKALKKNSKNLPLIIFIDLNLPFYSNDNDRKNSIQQIEKAVKTAQRLFSSNDQLRLIVFTNFPFHYGKPESIPPPTEHCFALPTEIQGGIAGGSEKRYRTELIEIRIHP